MQKYLIGILMMVANNVAANSLLDLTDDQFIRLLGDGLPDECINYYRGDMRDLSASITVLKVIDTPGYSARDASEMEQQETLNELLIILEKRCYQDVRRLIVSNNYYKDLPKHLHADDFSDKRVIDRYLKLIGEDK